MPYIPRPQDDFIEIGQSGGLAMGYIRDIRSPVLEDEKGLWTGSS